jgi:YesN/AraC family two-component response regulator
VLEAADGREGLATGRAHGETISLVVTDVVMPWLGGKELAEELAKVRPNTRVLFLSGYTEDESMRAGISEHAVDFIAKPFSPSALARKVREVLDRPSDEREATPAR